jgi:hypothetical protein
MTIQEQFFINEAITTYGADVVAEVRAAVALSDPDGAWAMFEDMGMFDHVACLEDLYF